MCVRLYPMLNHFLRLQGKVLGEGGAQRSGCRTKPSWEREGKINTKVKPAKEFVNAPVSQHWLILSPSYLRIKN